MQLLTSLAAGCGHRRDRGSRGLLQPFLSIVFLQFDSVYRYYLLTARQLEGRAELSFVM